jgi:hypothetical protein
LLEALQDSWLAHTIGESQMLTASLSALHLVGFTLVMGSALVSGLRLLGVTLREVGAIDVIRPATRVLLVGLSVSAVTGSLLFVPRAAGAAANDIFRLKLTLLLGAVLVHFAITRRVAGRGGAGDTGAQRATGALGLALWVGVALAGCAFILLE